MDNVLAGAQKYAATYINDTIAFSQTWVEHIHYLRDILKRFQVADLTAKLTKCKFGVRDCTFLRHTVTQGCVKPDEAKVQAIQVY